MPWTRPTLTQLISQAAADISSAIPGADALLRFANLTTLGKMLAGMVHLHYGYQDWIAKQAVPFTATDEFLQGWAALKDVVQKAPTIAGVAPASPGKLTFTDCTPTETLPTATPLVRGDGVSFIVTTGAVVDGGGVVVVDVAATEPGAAGNCDVGIILTLGTQIAGIQSSGAVTERIAGGADIESEDDFRNRMLLAYQNPVQGGAASDYVRWALEVAGVTRAWCRPNGLGAGTVVVYFMMDEVEAAHGGFPQGTNGTATLETRDSHATGDQLVVANYIFPLQPVTALIYAAAPDEDAIDFTISGLTAPSVDLQAAIAAAIDDVFIRKVSPGGVILPDGSAGGTVDLSDIETAIAAVPTTEGFVIEIPAGNITSAPGFLATRGIVTYI